MLSVLTREHTQVSVSVPQGVPERVCVCTPSKTAQLLKQLPTLAHTHTLTLHTHLRTHPGCGQGVSLVTGGGGPVSLVGLGVGGATIDCGGSGRVVRTNASALSPGDELVLSG